MSEVKLTGNNFQTEVLESDVPVLVDFWATWCGPCKMIAPVVEEISVAYKDKLKVGKVNVDDENELAREYRIMSIPTLLLFKNGKVADMVVGFRSKAELEEWIDSRL